MEPWMRHVAQERATFLQREAATERLARLARGRSGEGQPRTTPLLTLHLIGRLWLRVELWPR